MVVAVYLDDRDDLGGGLGARDGDVKRTSSALGMPLEPDGVALGGDPVRGMPLQRVFGLFGVCRLGWVGLGRVGSVGLVLGVRRGSTSRGGRACDGKWVA